MRHRLLFSVLICAALLCGAAGHALQTSSAAAAKNASRGTKGNTGRQNSAVKPSSANTQNTIANADNPNATAFSAPSAQQQQQQQQNIQGLQSQFGNNPALQKQAQTALHPGPQPDGSIIGIIGDSKCGRQHWDRPGMGPAGCARWCVDHGASYILITTDKIYKLSGDQSLIDNYAGEPVQIKGGVGGDSIRVQSITQVDLPVSNTLEPHVITRY
jgi:hypothetical protein